MEDGPMSRQVNFFAGPEDSAAFNSWLLDTFPDWEVVFYDSSLHQASGSISQRITAELLGKDTICLVPKWAKDKLKYTPPGSMVALDLFDSPVLEYSPCRVEPEKGCVKTGRIYWAFRGGLGPSEKKHVA